MSNINLKNNTPNLDRLARDSRLGTMPVSLKVKNKTYAILEKAAEANNTSVGSIINELLNNYIELDINHLYTADDEDNARQFIKSRMQRLARRLYNFNDIELSAYICEQSKKGLIDNNLFGIPSDVDCFLSGSDGFDELFLNTTSAPSISIGDCASFDPNLDSIKDGSLPFPVYCLTVKRKCAKLVLPLLFAYVDDYNKYIMKENYSEVPCISEHQFKELAVVMNADLDKKQTIDKIVEVLTND